MWTPCASTVRGSEGAARDTVIRGWPTSRWPATDRAEVAACRYRCADCGQCVAPRHQRRQRSHARSSRGTGLRWALKDRGRIFTVARVGAIFGSRDTANNAVLAEGKRLPINDPTRLEGVKVIGVDEHVWRHTRRGDKYVTVIIDLTPVRDGAGPARLLDMVEGRSKAFKTWLADPRRRLP